MRVTLILCPFLYSCKGSFTPPPPAQPEGIYQGYDSALYVHDNYSPKMFGGCVDVRRNSEGQYYFFDKVLTPIGENTYKFDYITRTEIGVGQNAEVHAIRRVGTFKFSYNHVIVEYSVGDSGQVMSNYKFNGWR